MSKLIPEEIQVGPYAITVGYEKNLYIGKGSTGEYHPKEHKIILEEDMEDTERCDIFLHEAIEAVKNTFDLQGLSHHDLSVLATGLAQALQPIWKEENND